MEARTVLTFAAIRQAELLQQAEQHRLKKQAAKLHAGRGPRGGGVRAQWLALRARFGAMRRRPGLDQSPALTPAASETI
jgi:hypothetical protein